MSYVTTVIVISPNMTFPDDVNEFITKLHHGKYFTEGDRMPVIRWDLSEHGNMFGGGKVPGASALWIGWNYCPTEELTEGLKQFQDLTLWWETEGEFAGLEKINWTYPRN